MKKTHTRPAKRWKDHPADWRPMSESDKSMLRLILGATAATFVALMLCGVLILKGG